MRLLLTQGKALVSYICVGIESLESGYMLACSYIRDSILSVVCCLLRDLIWMIYIDVFRLHIHTCA